MAFYDKFPYTNFQELNLDLLIRRMNQLEEGLDFVVENASLKYADPIAWNIASQYQSNTVVVDPATGTAYISTRPVPTNVLITDTDYWTPIFSLQDLFDDLSGRIDDADTDIAANTAAITALNNKVDALESDIFVTLENVTDLIAYDGDAGEYVRTIYHTNIQDRGGALYHIENNLTQNNIDIIGLANGRFARFVPENSVVNVAQLGAVADADITTIMQRAVEICEANHYMLVLNASDYHVNSPILVNTGGFEIRGIESNKYTDADRKWHLITDTNINMLELAPGEESLIVTSLYMRSSLTTPTGTGIHFNKTYRNTFRNCLFYLLANGILGTMSDNGWAGEHIISDNMFFYCGVGVRFNRETGVSNAITDCYITKNLFGYNSSNSIYASNLDGFIITENHLYGSAGIYCANTIANIFTNNYFDTGENIALNLEGAGLASIISNNIFMPAGDGSTELPLIWVHGGEAIVRNNAVSDRSTNKNYRLLNNYPSCKVTASGNIGKNADKLFTSTAVPANIKGFLNTAVYSFKFRFGSSNATETFSFGLDFGEAPIIVGTLAGASNTTFEKTSWITSYTVSSTELTVTRAAAGSGGGSWFKVMVGVGVDFDNS